jgi:hypothetical protein
VLGVVLWAGVSSVPALGAGPSNPPPPAEVSATLTEAGGGQLIANGASNAPEQTWTWQLCNAAGEACTPFGSGREIETGAAPGGVTFRATSNTGLSALSPVWSGPLLPAAAPLVVGTLHANRLIGLARGGWAGGWAGDFERTQLSACPAADGVGCVALAGTNFGEGCPDRGTVIDPDFAGWYLRVASVVYGPNTSFALPGLTTLFGPWPYGDSVWRAGPNTTVIVIARIGAATGPRSASCGPPALVPGLPPRVAVRVHSAWLEADGTATVQCFGICTVDLHASAHHRYVAAHSSSRGELRLRIPPCRLSRLGHGPIRYTLFIDGHVARHA